jgi:hypothetical protein
VPSADCHSAKRSYPVGHGPKTSRGSARQGHPVHSTWSMPLSQVRSLARRRPSFACDGGAGRRGSSSLHRSSGTSRGVSISRFSLSFSFADTRLSCWTFCGGQGTCSRFQARIFSLKEEHWCHGTRNGRLIAHPRAAPLGAYRRLYTFATFSPMTFWRVVADIGSTSSRSSSM